MTTKDPNGQSWNVGLGEALSITLGALKQMPAVNLPLLETVGLVAAEDVFAVADCPSAGSALRDGYAVVSRDLEGASPTRPVRLRVVGTYGAGDRGVASIGPGLAMKVMTGARLPGGADTVIEIEATREEHGYLLCPKNAAPGEHVLDRGSDVSAGERLAAKGDPLTPGLAGLLAAGGVHRVPVIPMPRVGVVAIGDEVVPPGMPLQPGQVYASNLVTLCSWLRLFGIEARSAVAKDHADTLRETFTEMLSWADVLLTSGGAWKSERDMTVRVLEELGGNTLFRGVRMIPGKAVAFGTLQEKGIFFLPGGPPANEMAFLQIALPGLLHMGGKRPMPFPLQEARMADTIKGDMSRTRFYHATLERRGGEWWAFPLRTKSRLRSEAWAHAIIQVPEGVSVLCRSDRADVQFLCWVKSLA